MLPKVPKGLHGINQYEGPFRDVLRAGSAPVGTGHQVQQAYSMYPLGKCRLPLIDSTLVVALPDCHPIGRYPPIRHLSLPDQFERLVHNATDVAEEHVRMVG